MQRPLAKKKETLPETEENAPRANKNLFAEDSMNLEGSLRPGYL